ncbi:hypothetical protein CHU98_g8158 [Xylaria longipes]|nr:hypothetical protein CHU98_g8158 [Xylaria longipes]
MTSTGAIRAEAPASSSRRRPLSVDVLLGHGMDSDDEEGGTPLTPFVAATQPLGDTNTTVPGRNDSETNESDKNIQGTPNNPQSIPKTRPNKNRILDWFLGRHAHSTSEDLTSDPGPQGRDHIHGTVDDFLDIGDVREICPACTTSYRQALGSIPFRSSLKLIYNDAISHKWLIGNKYVLHEALDDHPEDEYVPLVEASRALRTLAPIIPIPKVRAGWKENGKVITITDTIPGERLYDIWWGLSDAERENIAKQVATHIESWRESDLGRVSSLIGGPVYYHDSLFGTTGEGFGPFGSDLELWQAIEQHLKKKGIDGDMIQLLKEYMPASSPCLFTHGDLSSTNIIVHEGEVVAMTGFENAASLPAWAENVAMHFCYCTEDEQWKALLSKYTRSYPAAQDWWSLWTAVEDGSADHAQLENLRDRCRRWKKTEILGQPFRSIWLSREDSASKRLDIQQVGSETKVQVGDLIRQAIVPDLFQGRYHQDTRSESSWGCSTDDERRGSADDNNGLRPKKSGTVRKRGLMPYHQIQRQHHTLVSSASGPPRQTIEALSREHRELIPKPPSGKQRDSTPNAAIDSEVDSESRDNTTIQSRPQSRNKPEISDDTGPDPNRLRPLSLPSLTLSKSTRSELRSAGEGEAEVTATASASASRKKTVAKTPRSLSPIREDAPGEESGGEAGKYEASQCAQRTSMFNKNKVVQGSPYTALGTAPAETRPTRRERSKSEERTRSANAKTEDPGTSSRRRMLQPATTSFRHAGFEGRGRVRDGDEKYGFR